MYRQNQRKKSDRFEQMHDESASTMATVFSVRGTENVFYQDEKRSRNDGKKKEMPCFNCILSWWGLK